MKRAIINVADCGALESTAYMLEQVGYECVRPTMFLIERLRGAGLENVLSVYDLVKDWGYDEPIIGPFATLDDMTTCDLFVDTKGHVNYLKIVEAWPNLKGKVLWCCLNGGDPRKRTDGLPWADPPCPVLTNNQWYQQSIESPIEGYTEPRWRSLERGLFYTCYPPYRRFNQHRREGNNGPPICLVHNVERWGYGELVQPLREMGVKFYGTNSPDGLIPNSGANELLRTASCMVHLKAGDTVSYAVLAAIASRCPIICTQHYIDECRLHELLIHGETCFVANDTTEFEFAINFTRSIKGKQRCTDVSNGAYTRLQELMWKDVDGFAAFMRRNFP